MNIEELNAYEILSDRYLDDVKSRGLVLRHRRTGAKVAVLSNQDENKVFYIGFRTPPEDETGVPHIIEHTTLCGSEKYPVKDPFIELVKGSLNTFLNAITFPDKTVYPLASCNDQDFHNLMDVYLDAVFHPNITRYQEIFKQEGWHYELDSPDGELTINGVVYNEMKGAYSSPEEVLQTEILVSLFPDNCYGKNSGGDPARIPDLTYEAYLDFYHHYYHPSNSYIYLYGNMDVADQLDYIDREYLSAYDYLYVDSEIKDQPAFTQTPVIRKEYSAAEEDTADNAAFLAWNRVVGQATDPLAAMAFDVLDYALISSPGAPLFNALQAAGIGEDDYGQFVSDTRQMVFSVIAKNAGEEDREKFEQVILDTLQQQVRDGINRDTLLAAINSSEFKFREGDYGRFPKGLLIGIQCLESWMFDEDHPFARIECLKLYDQLKEKLNTRYFEDLVENCLISNHFGSTLIVAPRQGKNREEEKALAQKLAAYKASLSPEEVEELIRQTKALHQYQETPTPDEQLRTIPMLRKEDLKRDAMPLFNIENRVSGIPVIRHEVETNGICYMTLYFDTSDIPVEELGYLGLMSEVLGYMDTQDCSYEELSNRINIKTGGITFGSNSYGKLSEEEDFSLQYETRAKVLNEHLAEAEDLILSILLKTDFSDTGRMKEIVGQTKARLQNSLSSQGNRVAVTRASASFDRGAWYEDATGGISYYRFISSLQEQLDRDPSAVQQKLTEICGRLFVKNRLMISITGREEAYGQAVPELTRLISALPEGGKAGRLPEWTPRLVREGFTDASMIQYVARCGNFRNKGFSYTGCLNLLKNILSMDYLWNNVRVLGGAYGAMTDYGRNGNAFFASFRDPNLEKTNQTFEGIPDYLRSFDCDEREMTKYVIGTFGAMDTPLTPEGKGERSMRAWLTGLTVDMLQKERDQILSAGPADIRALADLIQAVLQDQAFCVIGNESAIQKAASMFDRTDKLCS